MNTYKRHRFSLDIISYAVWLYHRFNLSNRDIEDLLAERGIIVSYESIRLWCIKFGARYSRSLKQRHRGYGDTFYLDEVFLKINGKQQYLWRCGSGWRSCRCLSTDSPRWRCGKALFQAAYAELWWRAQEYRNGQIEKLRRGPSKTDA